MPTPIDSLKRGQYITIVGCKSRIVTGEYTGRPVRILEISLPFMAVTDEVKTWSVDVRFWEFQRVSKRYYDALIDNSNGPEDSEELDSEDSGWAECPRCGSRLAQKFVHHAWHMFCRTCHLILENEE